MKSKRSLMKFLRYLGQSNEEEGSSAEEGLDMTFPEFLHSRFQVPSDLFDPLRSLSLSPYPLSQTTAGYALPKIKRHLQSIGVFGPGFSSVLAKWGGGSEIAQVACRACAVGGGVYALSRGIKSVETPKQHPLDGNVDLLNVHLSNGESVRTRFVVGSAWDILADAQEAIFSASTKVSRSVMIVSSPLESLFPPTSDNGPVAAGTIVVVPGREIVKGDGIDEPPLYLLLHSSDTGECPSGQCVIYGSVLQQPDQGQPRIDAAVKQLLKAADPGSEILWKMQFTHLGYLGSEGLSKDKFARKSSQILLLPPPCLDIEFNDCMIDQVRHVWKELMGADADDKHFLVFEDREASEEPDS
ncbi:conserved hypothetical protein [Uncinocarpus reesii 1704]|uniref:Uncharacterized protein n=1 Tax=Uncinocarpus reesii (strain UAMH 1704) TaxID=336963 RepID=C4JPC0_UNCRE|nr:uncharacterized protein UREG_04502 [Uncinocarpus reesii 1704]EEP79656.1 conserved hypothetical protein [Uncinocarpus reesii 1704]